VIEQGHITDRYTKAIEQLGKLDGDKPNIEVRLGAIYALERIAFDSPRDHWTIMEVLTAYVRQNAPIPSNSTGPIQQDLFPSTTTSEGPRTDIQAILTVLGRRKRGNKREREGQSLNLSRSNLGGASLFHANLQGASLYQANLQGVKGLTVEQIKTTRDLQTARYDPEFRQALGLSIEGEEVPNITEEH
jgi:Pentapeptide repeats (8 copies)